MVGFLGLHALGATRGVQRQLTQSKYIVSKPVDANESHMHEKVGQDYEPTAIDAQRSTLGRW